MDRSVRKYDIKEIQEKLEKLSKHDKKKKGSRFVLSALSSIPWVGGFLSASSALHSEIEQGKVNALQKLWLEEHQEKIEYLAETLFEIVSRLEKFSASEERLESEGYLTLVKKGFRVWDKSDTNEKKEIIRNLLTNAGATELCTDDLVRLFIDWIELFHEAHFVVIKEVYQNPGTTRGMIWDKMNDTRPAENSAQADLYKMLIRDLSTSGVIRQYKPVNMYGEFVKQPTKRRSSSSTYKSAFDDQEPYELTELGKQFVQYALNEVVPKIGTDE
ncbi:hypothetical protein [Marinifilum fragile]|uniref:hypothetical protein n=1 Tax=Marinifilum fragile TaxID=570161 RepID=UPI002AA7C74B|nr:hypothetical protein [Marinifilum fragile]